MRFIFFFTQIAFIFDKLLLHVGAGARDDITLVNPFVHYQKYEQSRNQGCICLTVRGQSESKL